MGKRFFSGIQWNLFGALAVFLLNFLQLLWLVRLLDRPEFALFALAAVPINLGLQLQEGGINAAVVQRPDNSPEALSSLFWLNLAIGIVLFAGTYFSGPLLSAAYASPRLTAVLRGYAWLFLINAFGVQYKALLQKALRFSALNISGTVAALFGVVLSIGLAYRGAGAFALVGGQLARAGVENLFNWYWGRNTMRLRPVFSRRAVRPYLPFLGYHLPERLLTTFIYQLDILLIGRWLGADTLGAYDVFKRAVVRPASLLAAAVERTAFPLLSRLQGQPEAFRGAFHRLLGGLGAIQFPAYLLLGLLAWPLIPLLFGDEWTPYAPVFQALCLLMGTFVFTHPLDSVLLALGEVRRLLFLQALAGPLIAGAIWVGAAQSLTAVVLWMSAAQVLFILISYYGVLRPLSLWRGRDFFSTVLPPLAISLACGLVLYPGYPFMGGLLYVIAAGVGFLVLYLTLSRWFNPLAMQVWQHLREGEMGT